jgi:hypothetical protein
VYNTVDVDVELEGELAPATAPALEPRCVFREEDDSAERRRDEGDFELPASLIIRAGTSKMSKIGGMEGTSTMTDAAMVAAPRLVWM